MYMYMYIHYLALSTTTEVLSQWVSSFILKICSLCLALFYLENLLHLPCYGSIAGCAVPTGALGL